MAGQRGLTTCCTEATAAAAGVTRKSRPPACVYVLVSDAATRASAREMEGRRVGRRRES